MKLKYKIIIVAAVVISAVLAAVIINAAWMDHLEKARAATEGWFK